MRARYGFGSVLFVILPLFVGIGCFGSTPVTEESEVVVLLHGLGRTDMSMIRMQNALTRRGYRVVNLGYPATQPSIEPLAADVLGRELEACCTQTAEKIHFVTHSMGGIVLRYHLENFELDGLGRVVMLSPPNQGSELADWVRENPLLQRLVGPSVEQLGTGPESLPKQLGPVDFELGIITGDRTLNPLFSRMIPGADDGKVSVESAKVTGMTDFLVVPHSHTYIMLREDVVDQVVHFLEHGEFQRDSAGHPARVRRPQPPGLEAADHVAGAEWLW